jgi:hypothetical protein
VLQPSGSAAKIEYVAPTAINHGRARLSQPAARSSQILLLVLVLVLVLDPFVPRKSAASAVNFPKANRSDTS